MKRSISVEEREAIKAKGFTRFLLVDGLLKMGGLFAVLMTVFGYFIDYLFDGSNLADYVVAPRTWIKFVVFFLVFGLVTGYFGWKTNEKEILKARA